MRGDVVRITVTGMGDEFGVEFLAIEGGDAERQFVRPILEQLRNQILSRMGINPDYERFTIAN